MEGLSIVEWILCGFISFMGVVFFTCLAQSAAKRL